MNKYLIFDRETENHEYKNRVASPFCNDNWTIALGWKKQGDSKCSYEYYSAKHLEKPLVIPDDVAILVGHNIKFDLLYGWSDPGLKNFLKRGGKIWCTQYAEYLLEGQVQESQMNSMDSIVLKYGGRKKIDSVKALWESGFLTSQIDKDMLIDYLVGTEQEGRNSGDIGNTELIFLGQLKKAAELGMVKSIMTRMDGLLCTTEMEYNGLKIDIAEAKRRMDVLNNELVEADKLLSSYIPEMPEGLEFNWNSNTHKSCLIFGGTIKYKKSAPYVDPDTGDLARFKKQEDWPLFNGSPVDPSTCKTNLTNNCFYYVDSNGDTVSQDVYSSGKKKGDGKYKKVAVQGDIKTKIQDFLFTLPGYTTPLPEWRSKNTDGVNDEIYFTNDDVITSLGNRDVPFLKVMSNRSNIIKDLGTYYARFDEKKKTYVGMLTCVGPDHIVHHSLNHTSTITSRLSSSKPNLQNIPRGDTSEVKRMFISRFEGGSILEVDYSQLEVVVLGLLSGDKNLCNDLNAKIDFHCKRVAAKYNVSYEEALYRCKDTTYPDHATWKKYRTKCKEFSFQRAYGAGAKAIADSTGMSIEDVEELIRVEDELYPDVAKFHKSVEESVKASLVPFRDFVREGKVYNKGVWVSPTKTRYVFRTYDSPEYHKRNGINESLMPTEMKNYPTQGTGGELVQMILGKLFRHFLAKDNYGGKALLGNTVHDCVWFDLAPGLAEEVSKDVKTIMEDIPRYCKEIYNIDCNVPFPVELEIGPNLFDKQVVHIN